MAVGIRQKFAGGTQAQYEAVHGHINVEDDPPDGLIFHMAGPIDEGWGVIDCWESREAFDAFVQSRLAPSMQALGDQAMQGPPDIRQFEVFNYTKP